MRDKGGVDNRRSHPTIPETPPCLATVNARDPAPTPLPCYGSTPGKLPAAIAIDVRCAIWSVLQVSAKYVRKHRSRQ